MKSILRAAAIVSSLGLLSAFVWFKNRQVVTAPPAVTEIQARPAIIPRSKSGILVPTQPLRPALMPGSKSIDTLIKIDTNPLVIMPGSKNAPLMFQAPPPKP
jgi:hypothetical protein